MDKTLNFNMYYVHSTCSKFSKNEPYIIKEMISKGRLGETLKFNTFGEIEFDEVNDKQHLSPTFFLEKNITKPNGILFDMENNYLNQLYNKCIIYTTHPKGVNPSYGFVMFNTNTNKFHHTGFIEDSYDELIYSIQRVLNSLNTFEELKQLRIDKKNLEEESLKRKKKNQEELEKENSLMGGEMFGL